MFFFCTGKVEEKARKDGRLAQHWPNCKEEGKRRREQMEDDDASVGETTDEQHSRRHRDNSVDDGQDSDLESLSSFGIATMKSG